MQSLLALLGRQRALLHDLNQRVDYEYYIIRKYLAMLNLEEYKLREKQLQPTDAE